MYAMNLARYQRYPDCKQRGLRALPPLALFTSKEVGKRHRSNPGILILICNCCNQRHFSLLSVIPCPQVDMLLPVKEAKYTLMFICLLLGDQAGATSAIDTAYSFIL
jgi:hypothetical protein